MHYLIVKHVIREYKPKIVLDLGCGAGLQSYLHYIAGSEVVGLDISSRMINIAKNKIRKKIDLRLFPEKFNFVRKYNNKIKSILIDFQNNNNYFPVFTISDAANMPFQSSSFNHINCCGSVFSLVDTFETVLAEMARVLQTHGTIFLEVESRWSMDRIWTLVDSILSNKIGFPNDIKNAVHSIVFHPSENIIIDYPYGEYDNPKNIKVRLFTHYSLKKYFQNLNLKVIHKWNIHSFTNLIPSIILDTDYPSKNLVNIFKVLSTLEEKALFSLFGNSMVFLLQK
jgi:MPBQ/MSBQ methyltransferase